MNRRSQDIESKNEPCNLSIQMAYLELMRQVMARRNQLGFWEGRLSDSALSTATAISALSCYIKGDSPGVARRRDLIRAQVEQGLIWLRACQNEDGGWGDTDRSYSNNATTMLVRAAVELANATADWQVELERAAAFVERQGGIAGIRARYGADKTFSVPILANAAIAGLVPWNEVAALPLEATLVPQKFYHLIQLPVVSYAIPALVAIGQVKFVNDCPRNPISRWLRRLAVPISLRLLDKMQPASGGFLEAVPLTSFVTMGLVNANQAEHPVVERSVDFILQSFREEGSWPIDTNLAIWNTTLTINALASGSPHLESLLGPVNEWRATLEWLLNCQHRSRHPFTGAAPGGWGWTDLTGAVPDADDTPGAMLALENLSKMFQWDSSDTTRINSAIQKGCRWLLGLQNRNGGWPTFCRGWGRLPFDRSGADITAHAIRGLLVAERYSPSAQITKAIERGFAFLRRQQQSEGSWLPLWFGNQDKTDDINPFYGTAKVLLAYIESGRFDTIECQNGLNWLRRSQNVDGSWGGGISVEIARQSVGSQANLKSSGSSGSEIPFSTLECVSALGSGVAGKRLGSGTFEETALCLESLMAFGDECDSAQIERGMEWLSLATAAQDFFVARPIGFYFAKLWYYEQHYPLVFGLAALGRAVQKESNKNQAR